MKLLQLIFSPSLSKGELSATEEHGDLAENSRCLAFLFTWPVHLLAYQFISHLLSVEDKAVKVQDISCFDRIPETITVPDICVEGTYIFVLES